jgi:hypothetical protein
MELEKKVDTTFVSSFEEESRNFASGTENPAITEVQAFGLDGEI